MDKNEFFQDLEEIVVDPLFIGNSKEDIDQEISNNTWSISVSNEMNIKLSVKDFKDFLERLFPTEVNKLKCLIRVCFLCMVRLASCTIKI